MSAAVNEQGHPARREQRRRALQRQVARLERRLAALEEQSNRLTWARLLVFVAGFALSALLFFLRGPLVWAGALGLWLPVFALTVVIHRRVEGAISRHKLWRDLKRQHLARMALDWETLPATLPAPQALRQHPFGGDLDLVGERSLHHLIDTAVSTDGSRRLQQWLLETVPDPAQIERRQALVKALQPLSLFRDRLALQARLFEEREQPGWEAETLLAWMRENANAQEIRPWLRVLTALGTANLALLLLNYFFAAPPIWMAGVALYFLLYMWQSRAATKLLPEALALQDALRQLATVFSLLERPRFDYVEPVREVCAPFRRESRPPSQHLRALSRVVAAAGLSRNPVLWLALNAFFPWDYYFTYRLRRLRGELAGRLPRWLDAWFQLEAASALANLAYLNPRYTYPRVARSGGRPQPFSARQMGHPLIAHEEKVCNDFTAAALGDIFIVTGSNMAGKSSFLRTVGVNLCLAYAGGPVDADFLETDLFRLFTAIRVTDSVTDGISYFYAEVKRLKALLLALREENERPLFFLIDEIFRGTNNRERLLGSRAYIRALVGGYGVGLIATHDLELVQLAEEIPQVSNYHFRDAIREGRMVFDYRLRPGPSPTTNALKVMAAEGLPVPKEP